MLRMKEPQETRWMDGVRWTVPPVRFHRISENMRRWPAQWRLHIAHLDTVFQNHPEYILHCFSGFLVDLFPWNPTGYIDTEVGFSDLMEDPSFHMALVNMKSLEDLEEKEEYKKLLVSYAKKYIDYTHDGELHVYLFDALLEGVLRALSVKKAKRAAARKARVKAYYQELIAKAWHPSRFQAWCCDIEEQKEFRAMGWDGGANQMGAVGAVEAEAEGGKGRAREE